MLFSWWIDKAPDKLSEYVTIITFPRQQWLRERAYMFRVYVRYFSYWIFFALNDFYALKC